MCCFILIWFDKIIDGSQIIVAEVDTSVRPRCLEVCLQIQITREDRTQKLCEDPIQ